MKLFMAVSNKDTDSESIIGIFDSREKAIEEFVMNTYEAD